MGTGSHIQSIKNRMKFLSSTAVSFLSLLGAVSAAPVGSAGIPTKRSTPMPYFKVQAPSGTQGPAADAITAAIDGKVPLQQNHFLILVYI